MQVAGKSKEAQPIQDKDKLPIDEGSMIPSLREDVSYLAQVYNDRLQQKEQQEAKNKPETVSAAPRIAASRPGGVYVPPHKIRQLQAELMKSQQSVEHQKLMWQLLRKSINGIINKVNIANIQNVVIELLNENILRGKGLLARSIIKAQMASPNFTHVYAALIAVINTKLPEIVHLIIRRVLLQFQRSYHRNNKLVCMATTKMIAHLINQRVLSEYVGLQMVMVMLETPTTDSVEIACDFMTEVGQVMSELTPAGTNSIFEMFKNLLHEGQIETRVQYSIENLFAIRKTGFKDHPGVIPELDLVDLEDQYTHQFDLDEPIDGEDRLNVFKEDPFYDKTEQEWEQVKRQILGEENILQLKEFKQYEDEVDEQEPLNNAIQDLSEKDLINLRRTIYLTLQSTVDFEQCAHKIIKMGIAKGHEYQLCDMIVECCMMERIYQKFFGLLAQRFCELEDVFKENFIKAFVEHYHAIFKHETNKIRNLAKFFGHLFYTKALDWKIFQIIQVTSEATTAASRTFLKIMFREMAENMGIEKLHAEFNNPELKPFFQGLFPTDHPNNVRFAINYYTQIGLGRLSEEMREVLAAQEEQAIKQQQVTARILQERPLKQQLRIREGQQPGRIDVEASSSSGSSDSSDSESNSESNSSSSSSSPSKSKSVEKRKPEARRDRSRSRDGRHRSRSKNAGDRSNRRRQPRHTSRDRSDSHPRRKDERRRRDDSPHRRSRTPERRLDRKHRRSRS